MKPWMLVLGGIVLSMFLLGSCVTGTYNGMVAADERVSQAVGNIDSVTQRRLDLIPNLVEVVKGYAKHEKSTLEGVIQARASATQVKIDAKNATPEQLAAWNASQGQLSAALGKLMMLREQYPNLKADKQFSDLMAQLEGSENRIAEARRRYNEEVKRFNVTIATFPNNLVNSMFFHGVRKEAFKADEAAKVAPKVQM